MLLGPGGGVDLGAGAGRQHGRRRRRRRRGRKAGGSNPAHWEAELRGGRGSGGEERRKKSESEISGPTRRAAAKPAWADSEPPFPRPSSVAASSPSGGAGGCRRCCCWKDLRVFLRRGGSGWWLDSSAKADLPQGPDPEASSLQPPRPIFVWSSSSASTEYLHLSATCSFSPSCLSLNPSASPPRGIHNVEENLANLMALQNKQVEDRQEDLMVFRAHFQHVAVMNRQLQQLSMRLGQLEEMLIRPIPFVPEAGFHSLR